MTNAQAPSPQTETPLSHPLVICFGNPLLDLITYWEEDSFLKKYKLPRGSYCFQEADQEGIYEDLRLHHNPEYIAGGAGQNSIRVCQALLGVPGITAMSGTIGDDVFGKEMEALVVREGVLPLYNRAPSAIPTGVCAVVVCKKERSLCTRLAAAECYKLENALSPDVWQHVEAAKVVYSAGFFLSVCAEGMLKIAQACTAKGSIFTTNLSANYFVEFCKEEMQRLIPYADYIFGNETEWLHFSKVHGFDTEDLEEIVQRAALLPKASNSRRGRVIVLTQGPAETIVAAPWQGAGFKLSKYPLDPLPYDEIVDTNGAGDAFVGGFLSGLVLDRDLDFCVHMGHTAARHIVRRSGCTFDFSKAELPQNVPHCGPFPQPASLALSKTE